jgi:hypothetical protein
MYTKRWFAVLSTLVVSPALLFGAATISGKVTYTGTPAKAKAIDMSKEPSCAKQHTTPITTEGVVTGPNNSLANFVVYVSPDASDDSNSPAQALTFTQKGCQYIPHVIALRTGRNRSVVNEDQTFYNIPPMAKVIRELNKSHSFGTPPLSEKFDKEEFIPVKCNVHPWMHGYFAVLKTSHYTISGEDGSFKLPDLPAGKYTITAWQEDYGTQTQDVTISGSETKTVDFTFKAKPY